MRKFKNKNGGMSILGVLILVVIFILILSYFHISIQAVVESPETQENFNYVIINGKLIWDEYLKRPTAYLGELFLSSFKKDDDSNSDLAPELPQKETST